MSLIIVALLVSVQAAAQQPTVQQPTAREAVAPTSAAAPAPAPKAKEKKICKSETPDSGSHMSRRTCLTAEEWAARGEGMMNSSRAGLSASADNN